MIDESRLQELAEDFGEEEVAGLIDLFVDETLEALAHLHGQLIESPDADRSDQFHFIKGCARNLGASAFADQCEVFEKRGTPITMAEFQTLRADFTKITDYLTDAGLRETA